jgi:ribosomal protein S18 acetylase RimI-like enzyme
MKIRPTEISDLPSIKEVITACGLFPAEMLDDMVGPFLAKDSAQEFWLTLEDDKPFGIAYCAPERMTEGTWNLLLIALHPSRQGKGHGSRLMRHVEERLNEARQRILLVETSGLPEFASTRNFYAKLGYNHEARIRDYYNAGEDKIVFWKSIGQLGV